MIWNKKPKIEFYSLIPEVARIAPIQNARNFRPEILINATKEHAERKKCPHFGMEKVGTTAKCPGIYNYARHGWVLTTWQDIVIETFGDGTSYQWTTPIDQTALDNGAFIGPTVTSHGKDQYANYVGGIPNALQEIIKINTPWRCKVPEGYYLMEGPVPYANEHRFTTAVGFLDNSLGPAPINVQLFWHVTNGKTLIKAGTPIAHYLLVPKNSPELVVRGVSAQDIKDEKLQSIILARQYESDIKERKCIFAKIFGSNK